MPTSGRPDRSAPAPSIRDQIVAEARRELAAQGLPSMTVRQVARAIGVDPGTVRHYFPAKNDLVQAAVGVEASLLQDYRQTARAIGDDPDGTAAEAAAALLAAAERHLCRDPAAEVAMSVCVTGGDYEATVFGAFEREVVAPVARRFAAGSDAESVALTMAALLGLELLATLLPAAGRPLCEAEVRELLAPSIEHYLRAG